MRPSEQEKLSTLPADLLSLADYARMAPQFIDPAIWAWLEGGSGGLQALHANRATFEHYAIYNRLLVDCHEGSTATRILGQALDHPIVLAPIGYHGLVHPSGELATARGALDTLMVASTMASVPLEEIARAAAGPVWFQLYFQPDRDDSLRLVRRAEAAGYGAIMVTLDTPVQPASHASQKAGFALPADVAAVNLAENRPAQPKQIERQQSLIFQGLMSDAPRQADLEWLRSQTQLPLLAKGVSHPDDGARLIGLGIDGLVLSNHGGRALDCAPAPLAVLPAMRAAVGADATILLDGGVRTGSDVFKALALGANGVLVGRPQVHALAIAGSLGIAYMLKLLRNELELTMALAGCPTIASISRAALHPHDDRIFAC